MKKILHSRLPKTQANAAIPKAVRVDSHQLQATRRIMGALAGAALPFVLSLQLTAFAETNSAILEGIKTYKTSGQIEMSRVIRIKQAREQLVRVEYLSAASDYMSAREQLRLGALSSVRVDVRSFTNELDGVTPEMETELKAAMERLDTALRQRRAPEICREKAAATRAALDTIIRGLHLESVVEDVIVPIPTSQGEIVPDGVADANEIISFDIADLNAEEPVLTSLDADAPSMTEGSLELQDAQVDTVLVADAQADPLLVADASIEM